MLEGFAQAQAEYEARMTDPFGGEETETQYFDDYGTDLVEEMLLERLEREVENYLWN